LFPDLDYNHILCVAIEGMKRKTLKQRKNAALVCEKGIFEVEVINNLLIP
jgi:hypothetical protein